MHGAEAAEIDRSGQSKLLEPEGSPKSVEEGDIFFKEFIRPTLELCKELASEEKILAGGPISGTIDLALVVQADSPKELDVLVTCLPVWPRMETVITPGRATHVIRHVVLPKLPREQRRAYGASV